MKLDRSGRSRKRQMLQRRLGFRFCLLDHAAHRAGFEPCRFHRLKASSKFVVLDIVQYSPPLLAGVYQKQQIQRSYLCIGGLVLSPLRQSTAFGSTGHILTHVPQLVHLTLFMAGLSHSRFLMKVLTVPLLQWSGGVRMTSKSSHVKESILSPTSSMLSLW